jgi:hypothetical protein
VTKTLPAFFSFPRGCSVANYLTSIQKEDSATFELECAKQVVRILFEKTGLATILREAPVVIVGKGNWISFSAPHPVPSEVLLKLTAPTGKRTFAPGSFSRSRSARSKTSPSLHLTNLDSGGILQGHVDAYYWPKHPLAHFFEYLRRKTTLPSDLLVTLQK